MLPKRLITIHCSATKNGRHVPIQDIIRWHKKRGFRTVGYHLVIQPDGTTDRGRPLNQTGAHVKGYNRVDGAINLGICLIGMDKFSMQQFESLRTQLDALRMTFDIPTAEIYCHNEFTTYKSCPNMRNGNILMWYYLYDESSIRSYLI